MKTRVTLVSTKELDDQRSLSIVPADSHQRRSLGLSEARRAFFVDYSREKDPASLKVSDLRVGDVLFWQDPEENICDDGVVCKVEQDEGPATIQESPDYAAGVFAGRCVSASCPTDREAGGGGKPE